MSETSRVGAAWTVLLAVIALPAAAALVPSRTPENIQRKAVVVTHDALLYESAQGDSGKQAPFMQVYFLLEGARDGRLPVSFEPNSTEPDGWLAATDVHEWNSLQMIDFEAQSGRSLVEIFPDAPCAEHFGLTGEAGTCRSLGSEPQRSGKRRDDYALLVPVLERERDNYKGGFVRVTRDGPAVAPQPNPEGAKPAGGPTTLGYDLILAVDSTHSMQAWFKPTTEVLRSFVSSIRSQLGTGEVRSALNVGLLFYRDRKITQDCDIGYLTEWAADLSGDIDRVLHALETAQETRCGSDEIAEAVFDGLSRAVQDPPWNDGYFKVVLLVGDAPPHPPSNRDKNPLALSVESITKMSSERRIRFLTFKIGHDDKEAFESLAFSGPSGVRGRFTAIEPDIGAFQRELLAAMQREWEIVTKRNQVVADEVDAAKLAADPSLQRRLDIDSYELPIILANLPPQAAGHVPEEFVEGWVPKRVKGQLAMGEYVFMGKNEATRLTNVIETIALAAQEGEAEGGEAFITSLRSSLAAMVRMAPEDLFRSGESLESMMRKADVLPFRTTVLSFTAEELNAWSPADYQRLNRILSERTTLLRAFIQKPTNIRFFGQKPHLYVPRDLFP